MSNKEAIRKALDTATIDPWAKVKFHDGKTFEVWQSIDNTGIARMVIHSESEANAHLIANAPTWLRELLAENERLQEENEEWEKRVNEGWHSAGEETKKNESLQEGIESLRAELAEYRNAAEMANEELRAAERERDEARQANAALLEKLRDIRDNPSYGIAYKRWNRVEEMLAQYDTAQPTAPTVWTCGKCKNNFVGDDCPYCTAQGEEEANVTE